MKRRLRHGRGACRRGLPAFSNLQFQQDDACRLPGIGSDRLDIGVSMFGAMNLGSRDQTIISADHLKVLVTRN